jgi:hypothetical protein
MSRVSFTPLESPTTSLECNATTSRTVQDAGMVAGIERLVLLSTILIKNYDIQPLICSPSIQDFST